jgi:hypothetical protein
MVVSYGGAVFVTMHVDSDQIDDEPMLRQFLVDELKVSQSVCDYVCG